MLIGIFIARAFPRPRSGDHSTGVARRPVVLRHRHGDCGPLCLLAAWVSGVTFADSLVAFAPGGVEAMTMLALVLGLDPLYVGIHHLVRFIGIGLTVPFVVTWLQRNDPPTSAGGLGFRPAIVRPLPCAASPSAKDVSSPRR